MTIGELINNLAQKAGIAVDDAKLKSLLAAPELATVTVDESIVTAIDNGLLNIDAATNNHPKIKNKYFADAYDGIDKQLLKLVETDTFDQADLDEIKAEKSTSKKQELIISKLKSAKSKATGADKEEINRQLAAAHAAAKAAKDEVETVKTTYEGKIKDIQLKAAVKAIFGNYKTIYDELPPVARTAAMEALISTSLQDKNAELRTDENGNLTLVSKDGSSNVFGANHVQLTPTSFLDQTFAPILKVSGPPKPAATSRPQQPVNTAVTPAERHVEATNDFIKSHTEKVLADMGQSSVSMV